MNAVVPILVPTTFDQLVRFSELAADTDMVPRDYRGKPGNIMLACQMGSELGLSPMQSLNSIAIISGRPGVFGDGLIGICRQSPLCEDIAEHFEGEGETRTAVCVATRRGATPTTARFSVADAKRAGLWGKSGPWTQYPDRMLQNRARGFALRDAFPDLLRGLKTVEELRDFPKDDFRGQTIEAEREEVVEQKPKRPSTSEWLAMLRDRLAACANDEERAGILSGENVQKAKSSLTNGALEELNKILGQYQPKPQPKPQPQEDANTQDEEKRTALQAKIEKAREFGDIKILGLKDIIANAPEADAGTYALSAIATRPIQAGLAFLKAHKDLRPTYDQIIDLCTDKKIRTWLLTEMEEPFPDFYMDMVQAIESAHQAA